MSSGSSQLDDLRREIDEIDDALHDLLMRRAEVGERIGKAKGRQAAIYRPGREAQILRRLVARHRGVFPARVVIRIWREIVSAFSALQGPFAVAASAPESGHDLTHLARDHFGSESPIRGYESAFGVLRAVSEGEATVGLLPIPGDDDQEPWWRFLSHGGEARPRIVARLPFAPSAQRRPGQEALVVGLMPQEESGEDRSFLMLETEEPLSRSSLKQLLDGADFALQDIKLWPEPGQRYLHLIEVEGFLAEDDPRLSRLETNGGGDSRRHAWAVGGYAIPLSAEALDASAGAGSRRREAAS